MWVGSLPQCHQLQSQTGLGSNPPLLSVSWMTRVPLLTLGSLSFPVCKMGAVRAIAKDHCEDRLNSYTLTARARGGAAHTCSLEVV